jgi:hypothetical protein
MNHPPPLPTQSPVNVAAQLSRIGYWGKWIELLLSFGGLVAVLVTYIRVDYNSAVPATILALFPTSAMFITWRKRASAPVRHFASAYLFLLLIGGWVAESSLPGFTAFHNGNTDLADRFNTLPLHARRLIAWSTWLSGTYFFLTLGYLLFWSEWRSHFRGEPATLSLFTTILGLVFFWGVACMTFVTVGTWIITSMVLPTEG